MSAYIPPPRGNGILLVVSMEPKKPFAPSGDSGSLVWDINSGKTVGMVSYQLQNHKHRNELTQKLELIQATYVVRLNRCTAALESSDHTSITRLRCQLHGCSVPKSPDVRQSTDSAEVDSVETVQSRARLTGSLPPHSSTHSTRVCLQYGNNAVSSRRSTTAHQVSFLRGCPLALKSRSVTITAVYKIIIQCVIKGKARKQPHINQGEITTDHTFAVRLRLFQRLYDTSQI